MVNKFDSIWFHIFARNGASIISQLKSRTNLEIIVLFTLDESLSYYVKSFYLISVDILPHSHTFAFVPDPLSM